MLMSRAETTTTTTESDGEREEARHVKREVMRARGLARVPGKRRPPTDG
jgi:hypothetical protein